MPGYPYPITLIFSHQNPQSHLTLLSAQVGQIPSCLVSQPERPLPVLYTSLQFISLPPGGLFHTLKLGQPVPVPSPSCPGMGRLPGAQPGSCCPALASCSFLLHSSRAALATGRADEAGAGTAGALPI